MTKKVLVTIEGQQSGAEEEPIVVTAPGVYHMTNGNHYIQYEEILAESEVISNNTIKISSSKVILTKKLPLRTQMVFDLMEMTQTTYQTPYGDISLDINTVAILVLEEPDRIEVDMKYSLSSDSALISDNLIKLVITSIER